MMRKNDGVELGGGADFLELSIFFESGGSKQTLSTTRFFQCDQGHYCCDDPWKPNHAKFYTVGSIVLP